MADEVDPHQVGPVGNAGGGEDRIHGPRQLVDRLVDRTLVPEVNSQGLMHRIGDGGVIHDDDLGAQFRGSLGGRSTHPAGTADDKHSLVVVPELLDDRHALLLDLPASAMEHSTGNIYLVQEVSRVSHGAGRGRIWCDRTCWPRPYLVREALTLSDSAGRDRTSAWARRSGPRRRAPPCHENERVQREYRGPAQCSLASTGRPSRSATACQ